MSLDWMDSAACTGLPVDLFFPQGNRKPREALQICAGCPVRSECREFALRVESEQDCGTDSIYGVYGGLRAIERVIILSDRPPCIECDERASAGGTGGRCHRCYNRALRRRRKTQTTGAGQ